MRWQPRLLVPFCLLPPVLLLAPFVPLLVAPMVASASFSVKPGSFTVVPSIDQAGAHPDLTTSFVFQANAEGAVEGLARNLEVVLPVGFAGYPAMVRTCDPVQLALATCSVGSQIGTLEFVLRWPGYYGVYLVPLFNMPTSPNQTAVYGFGLTPGEFTIASGEIVVSVGPDYRVHARAVNIYSALELVRQSLTVWGVPADPSHDAHRGSKFVCQQLGSSLYFVQSEKEICKNGGNSANENLVPYLVNPTQCTTEPLTAELRGVTSWEGEELAPVQTGVGPFTGCSALRFTPTISVAPEQVQATLPSGYEVVLRVPQSEGAEGLATADLKDTIVRMPKGVVLSPSAGNGLESCGEEQVGLRTEQLVRCPDASKLGTVSVVTPALTGELKGALYLGGPVSGPITGPPFTVYLTFEGHGVHIKIRGTVMPDPLTGQLTTTFNENPELPFSELKLHLTGGSRATLANPSVCANAQGAPVQYSAESDLTPWSTPFTTDATPSSPPFEVTGCQGARFAPTFEAGTTSNQAGRYSPMSVTFSREDADQNLGGVTVTTPPGLSGDLSNVPLCPEPQAAQGTCPGSSLIGEVTAGAGPGPQPVYIKGGKVFLTGPYDGAPFGLSIDVSEKAGPLDLGSGPCDCEVVRASVNVDPRTAQLTVSNGALPAMKDGIPFQVKKVNVLIDRPEFVFNPTSCNAMSLTGTLSSTQGMSARREDHFQVTNCAALGFNPTFKVSTSGHAGRANGASLDARVSYPRAPFGSQANIASVKVQLPSQLPSRLKTLQKACVAAVFEADPANCPAASRVGIARATTPILPVPLTGPAIFVSHGGESFPSLEIVLQGYGVTVDLVGSTFIHKGITTSTFRTVPDVPVGSFELYLPQGPYSALAANGNLCDNRLVMPTEFVSQAGTVLRRSARIAVTGCRRATAGAAHKVSTTGG
jgi:hypothetical protein